MTQGEQVVLKLLAKSAGSELTERELIDRSDGQLSLGSITVYCERLLERQLITSRVEEFSMAGSARTVHMAIYRITDAGRRTLFESERLPTTFFDRLFPPPVAVGA